MNHGVVLPNCRGVDDSELLIELGIAAEESGWDGVFLGDHLFFPVEAESPDQFLPVFDPWVTLSALAVETDTLTLGSWVTPVPRRQPWQLARDLATLDHLSDGRVVLGVGLGTQPDYARFGGTYDQRTLGRELDEALEVISGLWSGEPFAYDGEFYSVDETVLPPQPVQQPRIPIVAGGRWPNERPIRRGAEWDGIMPIGPSFPMQFTRDELVDMLEYYHEVADQPGEIFLQKDLPNTFDGFRDVCSRYDVTWLLTSTIDVGADYDRYMERIRRGPPD